MRISDWSSDVCSSDLRAVQGQRLRTVAGAGLQHHRVATDAGAAVAAAGLDLQPGLEAARIHRLAREPGGGGQRIADLGRIAQAHADGGRVAGRVGIRSEEHTSELQSLMRISYAVFCLKKKKKISYTTI